MSASLPAPASRPLDDAADGGYDVVIAGTFEMIDFVAKIAPQYPDEKFITFDTVPDYTKCDCKNVLGIMYQTSSAELPQKPWIAPAPSPGFHATPPSSIVFA